MDVLKLQIQHNNMLEVKIELGSAPISAYQPETATSAELVKELTVAIEKKDKEIKQMCIAQENLEKTIQQLHQELETKVKEHAIVIEEKDKDLVSKGTTITHLMNEIKRISDARTMLETTLKDKDVELSKNFAVVLELRNEKVHLAATIKNMQTMIENLQKEQTPPVTNPRARFEPEQEENAVSMLTPPTKRSRPLENVGSELGPHSFDTMIMNFLSDDSMDANRTIDASLVNRRVPAATSSPAPGPSSQSGPRAQQSATAEERRTQDEPSATQVKLRKFFKTSRNKKRHTKF